ncbi:MAG: HU family DNA-binding protein [Phycisphaerales bacterium]|nr:HU family DNA-binding protein [Phycisphaerales bacterium]
MATKTAPKSATPKAPKITAAPKQRGKSELYKLLADHTGLQRKQVANVFEVLHKVMSVDLAKPADKKPKVFVVPGLMKVQAIYKPATKATTRANPFKPGEMMDVKAKAARTVIKVRPLKGLKNAV